MAHQVESLGLEYGTIVPMHCLNPDGWAKVVSVASPLFASMEESQLLGEATRRAIAQSGERIALLASGSLSHRLLPNKKLGPEAWTSICQRVQPPGRFARTGAVAAAPLPGVLWLPD